MNFLSYIMPKLAWFIPLCVLVFVGYVVYKNKQSDTNDRYIREHGVNIDAEINEITYDKYQRINNKLVAIVSVKYNFNGREFISKRGLNFLVTDKDKFKTGNTIKIKINPNAPLEYYYVDYRTY
ncbi:hypothetical protein ACQ3G7_17110 [Kosakonia oryzendophytica]|uniref:hypothetical protein n=1 Tax=Kosakonia TaxID=1330547 RepID=UPI0021D97B2A|nr:hypothetical protein [Kosakonia sp. ML.JS2a]UXY09492.1 hypothetical protein N7922_16640 [Kosakonia sp. ML.JS2a]